MSFFLQVIKRYHYFFVFLLFLIAGIYITFPLVFNLGTYATDNTDALLIAWIQNWNIHALITGNILSLFEANIYFPYHNSLAFSDVHIFSSILAAPILIFINDPIATVNISLIASICLLGFSIYIFSFYLTKNYLLSLFVGILVIFSPAILSNYVHIQVIGMQWFVFSLFFFLIFLDSQKSKYLVISLLFFIAQMYNSFLPGYFIIFSYGIIFGYQWFYKRKTAERLVTKKNIFILLSAFFFCLPVVIPYYQVSKEFAYSRQITEAIHLGLQPEDMLYSSSFSKLSDFMNNLPFNRISQNHEFKPGFMGIIFSLLAIFVIYYGFKYFKKKNVIRNSFVSIALVGIVLSLGPALHLGRHTIHDPFPIPLPYALFYYVFPGFQGLRNAARWEILFILAIAILIAVVLNIVFKKVSKKKLIVIYTILFLGVFAEFNPAMTFYAVPQKKDFPPVYSWLATLPKDSKIIEFPIYVWYMHPYVFDENMREYYSTAHFLKMVNGASGFSPPPWQNMALQLQKNFPSEETVFLLKKMGVNYVIIHKLEYDKLRKNNFILKKTVSKNGHEIINQFQKNDRVKFIKKLGDDYVYEI